MVVAVQHKIYLPSSSYIVTVAWVGLLTVTLVGSEDGSITRLNFSSPSSTLSLVITTVNETRVTPAGNVTTYGPEL